MVKIKQLSIFLTNQKGRLYNVLNILAENNINIRALSLTDTSEFGILRLIVDNPDKGEQILEANNYSLKTTQAIAVELEDVPGGLVSILKILNDNEINLNILYAFTVRNVSLNYCQGLNSIVGYFLRTMNFSEENTP